MTLRIDGGILAGGLATRMDGKDKGLQHFRNKAMAQWVYESLQPFVGKVTINCNRNQQAYQAISPYTCSDTIEGFQGPLAGLLSLMLSSDADYLLISPCDTPLLGREFAQRMLEVLKDKHKETPDKPLLIAAKDEERNHPLHLCISTKFAESLEQAIKQQQNRVMKWVKDHDVIWLDFSSNNKEQSQHFVNFNTIEDLNASS